eukprot:7527806-Alexandrium_andersonii.AAC.1
MSASLVGSEMCIRDSLKCLRRPRTFHTLLSQLHSSGALTVAATKPSRGHGWRRSPRHSLELFSCTPPGCRHQAFA